MTRTVPLLLVCVAACCAKCPVGTIQGLAATDCYYVSVRTPKSWTDAESECKRYGGHLTSVTNGFENTQIATMVAVRMTNDRFWVGGRRNATVDWSWSDGQKFAYQHWAPGEPNTRKREAWCMSAGTHTTQWYSNYCSRRLPFVCKIPPLAVVPGKGATTTRGTAITTTTTATSSRRPTTTVGPRCSPGFDYVANARLCLKVVTGACGYTWDTRPCRSNDSSVSASMVSIHDSATNVEIANYLLEAMRNTTNCHGKRYGFAWIGISAPWGEWEWVDDKPYNYSNWLYSPGYDCEHRRDCAAAIRFPDDGDQLGKWAYFYTSQAVAAYFPTVCARAPNF